MHRLVLIAALASCEPRRPPDEPRLPPAPVRIAIAKLSVGRGDVGAAHSDMRWHLIEWLDLRHGVAIERVPLEPLPISREIGQADALDSVRSACDRGRELGVDAVVYGDISNDQRETHRCLHHGGFSHDLGGECTKYSDEVASVSITLRLHLVVVHAATCGFAELLLGSEDLDRHAAPHGGDPWDQLRINTRREVPDALHRPPRFAPPPR